MRRTTVLISCRQMQNVFSHFEAQFTEREIATVLPQVVQQLGETELVALLPGMDGMIAGDDHLTARTIASAPRLKIISKWGVGTDNIDKAAAASAGVVVTNTPGVFGGEVADVAIGYVVMLARQLHRVDASVRAGGWFKHEGRSLEGMTIGIVGFGSIGQAIARRARGFGMPLVAYDAFAATLAEPATALETRLVPLPEMLATSDFVVLSCPLTPETRHLLNDETLRLLKPGSFVVNVARGPLIEEAALAKALGNGHVAAAALDVFEDEPLPVSSPLRAFPQCVFGSHNGSNTTEGVMRASALAVANLFAHLPT